MTPDRITAYGSKADEYVLWEAGVHESKAAADIAVQTCRGRHGFRTVVKKRSVSADGVQMRVWASVIWRKKEVAS